MLVVGCGRVRAAASLLYLLVLCLMLEAAPEIHSEVSQLQASCVTQASVAQLKGEAAEPFTNWPCQACCPDAVINSFTGVAVCKILGAAILLRLPGTHMQLAVFNLPPKGQAMLLQAERHAQEIQQDRSSCCYAKRATPDILLLWQGPHCQGYRSNWKHIG